MNANDPRLTAHALGEADAESAELIARDPALTAEAEQIERFAAQLRAELHAEHAPALRAEQREAVVAEARLAFGPARWWQRGPALGAAAACVALALGAAIYFQARHVGSLRPVARESSTSPSVKVRWADDTRLLPPEAVAAPHAPAPETRPTFQGPAPVAARPVAAPSPASLAEHASVPENAKPTPAPLTLPADPERVNAAPLRKR